MVIQSVSFQPVSIQSAYSTSDSSVLVSLACGSSYWWFVVVLTCHSVLVHQRLSLQLELWTDVRGSDNSDIFNDLV